MASLTRETYVSQLQDIRESKEIGNFHIKGLGEIVECFKRRAITTLFNGNKVARGDMGTFCKIFLSKPSPFTKVFYSFSKWKLKFVNKCHRNNYLAQNL